MEPRGPKGQPHNDPRPPSADSGCCMKVREMGRRTWFPDPAGVRACGAQIPGPVPESAPTTRPGAGQRMPASSETQVLQPRGNHRSRKGGSGPDMRKAKWRFPLLRAKVSVAATQLCFAWPEQPDPMRPCGRGCVPMKSCL